MNIDQLNFAKLNGLLPAIVQDAATRQVLMVGFMNREAIEATLREKKVTFWSRTKQRLWQKGETSGMILEFIEMIPDCDRDALLIKAKPTGPVCHTGMFTCFGESRQAVSQQILEQLEAVIRQRRTASPGDSYTARLFQGGTERIAQKIGEEAVEVALAAMKSDNTNLERESADLLYHLLVLLEQRGSTLADVTAELERRLPRRT